MTINLKEILFSQPIELWKVNQVVVLDWYDGPRMGLCEIASPQCCFQFELLAERPVETDLDDRLFRLNEAPEDAMRQMLSILAELGPPKRPVWIPIWKFDDEAKRLEAESKIDTLFAKFRRTPLIIQTRDMVDYLGCWISI